MEGLTVSILAQKVHGRITNYRTGPKEQTSQECLIEFENVTSVALGKQINRTKGYMEKWNNQTYWKSSGSSR